MLIVTPHGEDKNVRLVRRPESMLNKFPKQSDCPKTTAVN